MMDVCRQEESEEKVEEKRKEMGEAKRGNRR
jgi:hypothetical protein